MSRQSVAQKILRPAPINKDELVRTSLAMPVSMAEALEKRGEKSTAARCLLATILVAMQDECARLADRFTPAECEVLIAALEGSQAERYTPLAISSRVEVAARSHSILVAGSAATPGVLHELVKKLKGLSVTASLAIWDAVCRYCTKRNAGDSVSPEKLFAAEEE